MVDKAKLEAYWNENKKLTWIVMIIWFIITYVASFFSAELNSFSFIGFPFGYYMAAQGSLAIFVVLIFYYAAKMNKLDKKYGVEEEEEE